MPKGFLHALGDEFGESRFGYPAVTLQTLKHFRCFFGFAFVMEEYSHSAQGVKKNTETQQRERITQSTCLAFVHRGGSPGWTERLDTRNGTEKAGLLIPREKGSSERARSEARAVNVSLLLLPSRRIALRGIQEREGERLRNVIII